MIKIKRISCGFVNCYILSENGRECLIDTGTAKYRKKVLSICKRSNAELIVLTHGHSDHIQNAAYLAAELNIPIAIGQGDEKLAFDSSLQTLKSNCPFGEVMKAVSNQSAKKLLTPLFIPEILLNNGDNLKAYGGGYHEHIRTCRRAL